MTDTEKHLEHLAEIRSMMERSSRFLSLSGLSGVWAGLCALSGAAFVYFNWNWDKVPLMDRKDGSYGGNLFGLGYTESLLLMAVFILVLALAGGIFFTTRKAKSRGQKVWDHTTRRLMWALFVPLATGGFFCLGLLYWGLIGLVAPATLLFYGLALINGSKYTIGTIYYLGLTEIALGLIGVFYPGYGLELWALGFGVMHILYGALMYVRYERS